MKTQPHLLLLQKTMVMVEGVATALNPEINMWDTSAPYVRRWIREELGPESAIADSINENMATLKRLPDLVRRIEETFPTKGGAPEPPPLPEIPLIWEKKHGSQSGGWRYLLTALIAGGAGAAAMWMWG